MKAAVRAILIRDKKLLVTKRNKFGDKYYTLVGGGVDLGESKEQALVRELYEEANMKIEKARLVFIEEAGEPYGTQYVFLCQDPGGEPELRPDSDEAKISAMGKNIYETTWLDLKDLKDATFRSEHLKLAILECVDRGFPNEPTKLESV